ncbi:MAG: NUDIX hydrolase [Opitutaceae bacterium]|nr:NUDIX hydrolase [Opitutaceae bacterium]
MYRTAVLRLLRTHRPRAADPHEAAMTTEVIRFVETHPDCLLRTCVPGHLTGSAWIVDSPRRRTLLTHHRKLDKWLQPGGHADGDPDLRAVALREAREETGLTRLRAVSTEVFDVDRHWIPPRGDTPGHWHHDLRFLIEADPAEPLVTSDESHDLAWVELARVAVLNSEESLLRLVRKTPPWG